MSQRNNIPYKFHVVNTEDVNAFAVPGGYLYVNRGLIEAADTVTEMTMVKHHFKAGVKAQKGIEF